MKQQEQEAHCPFCEPESLAEWGWLDQPLKNADWGGIFWVTPLNPVLDRCSGRRCCSFWPVVP